MHLTLVDVNGNPLSGYQVNYRQTRHDFLFGGVANPFYANSLQQAGMNTITEYMGWNWIEPELGKFTLDFANYWLGIDELKSGGMFIKTNVSMTLRFHAILSRCSLRWVSHWLYNHVATTVKLCSPGWRLGSGSGTKFGNHNRWIWPRISITKPFPPPFAPSARTTLPSRGNQFRLQLGGIDWLDNAAIIQEMLTARLILMWSGFSFMTMPPQWMIWWCPNAVEWIERLLWQIWKDACTLRKTGRGPRVPRALRPARGTTGYWDVPGRKKPGAVSDNGLHDLLRQAAKPGSGLVEHCGAFTPCTTVG